MAPEKERLPRNGAELRDWARGNWDHIVMCVVFLLIVLGLGMAFAGLGKANGALASAGATVALVGITGYYAWQTRALVEETRRSHRANVVPVSVSSVGPDSVSPDGAGNWFIRLALENCGPGAAFHLSVAPDHERVCLTEWRGSHGRWRPEQGPFPALGPGETCHAFFHAPPWLLSGDFNILVSYRNPDELQPRTVRCRVAYQEEDGIWHVRIVQL